MRLKAVSRAARQGNKAFKKVFLKIFSGFFMMNKKKEVVKETEKGKSSFAVVRVRGSMGAKSDVEFALKQLGLTRKNHCVLVDSVKMKGVLNKVCDYVTWGEADAETAVLLEKVRALQGSGRVFRLQPPRKGFRGGTKRHFPKGALGYRGKVINLLIKSMLPINVK